jgi:Ca2+-binding EF-hand superfamily protein
MKTTMAALAALILCVTPLSAPSAQTMPAVHLLGRLDSNGDGTLSRDEVVAARERLFARFDVNGDGTVDDHEIEVQRDAIMDRALAAQARLGREARRMDGDRDGKVSRDDFRTRMALFDLADRDSNGRISGAEFAFIRGLLGAP